jgi:hypothetical protein
MATMEERVRELEARRAKGESVPELDAMYRKIDDQTNKAHAEVTKSLSGEMPDVKPLPGKSKPEKMGESAKPLPGKGEPKKIGEGMKKYASGGSVSSASSRADGIAQRGKTRGKIV